MEEIRNIVEYLVGNKIKPSLQRIKIFGYLNSHKNHPTVEMIHKELINEIPTLSKTTVYNTLKQFVSKGIVQIINIEDNEIRYDADTSTHGHFKCVNCGEVYDFQLDEFILNVKQLKGFKTQQTHVYIKGICNNCVIAQN